MGHPPISVLSVTCRTSRFVWRACTETLVTQTQDRQQARTPAKTQIFLPFVRSVPGKNYFSGSLYLAPARELPRAQTVLPTAGTKMALKS